MFAALRNNKKLITRLSPSACPPSSVSTTIDNRNTLQLALLAAAGWLQTGQDAEVHYSPT